MDCYKETTKSPYIIEQFRWEKWMKIAEIDGRWTPEQTMYSFLGIHYYGENLCRVKISSNSNDSEKVKWTREISPVNFSINKKASKIEFSDEKARTTETMYEIANASETIIKMGWAKYVSYNSLPKGTYPLYYDNKIAKFKR
jgi:hypothetical protein